MLVRTPLPMVTESLLGYVLRLSEQNGYDTPWRLLSLASIPRRQALSLDFPVEPLVALLKCPPGSLDSISYSARKASGEISYKILKTELGSRIRRGTFRLATPAFCPACVLEKGFIEAHWDIRLVTCCSHHQCALLSHCPNCLKPISWFRPGLLTCTCGAEWRSVSLNTASLPLVAINDLLTASILNQKTSNGIDAGLPKELTALSPRSLLTILGMLSDVLQSKVSDNALPQSVEQLLYRWPRGYLKFLDAHTQTGRMSGLSKTIQRAGLPQEAKRLFLLPVQQRLPPLPIRSKGPISRPVNRRRFPLEKRSIRDTLGDRQAAALLDIPVSTLNTMRAEGNFKVRHEATPRSAYHRRDLEEFLTEFIIAAKKVVRQSSDGPYVTLGTILKHWKFGNPQDKANLLVAIRDGTIPSYTFRKPVTKLSALHLLRSDAENYMTRIRQFDTHKGISPYETSKVLHCDPDVVTELIRRGYLRGKMTATNTRVTRESLTTFAMSFASIASLANSWNTSSRRLLRLCNVQSIDTLDIPRQRSGTQHFIRRSDIHRLSATFSL